jgi:hypothetical protein
MGENDIYKRALLKCQQSITTILHLFENKIQENLELVKEYDPEFQKYCYDSVRLSNYD